MPKEKNPFLTEEEAETIRQSKPKPPVITPEPPEADDAMYDYYSEGDRVGAESVHEFKQHKDNPTYTQAWEVIPAPLIIKIWQDYARWGVVHNERGMRDIVYQILQNIHKIEANNILTGHTPHQPHDYANELTEDDFPPDYFDGETDFFNDGKGQWRISDYAASKLTALGIQLQRAKTPEEQLVLVDMILNVVHQRSDIADWFVEGGNKTLMQLSS